MSDKPVAYPALQGRAIRGKGSAERRRTEPEREADLALEAQYYCQGLSMRNIAIQISTERPYTISLSTVYKDIEDIKRRWRETETVAYQEALNRELTRIDALEKAYWDGWFRSIGNTAEEYQELSSYQQGKQLSGKRKSYTRKKESVGDVLFLQGVTKCIQERAKILGLYAPEKLEMDFRLEASKYGIDPTVINGLYTEVVEGLIREAEAPPALPEGEPDQDGS
jgi:hypothetical protein